MKTPKTSSLITSLVVLLKKLWSTFVNSLPHHWFRAIMCLGLTVYLIYLLHCFTTIPVKDYYFDISAMSSDSIVPEIFMHVGDENVMNTYSGDYHVHSDSIFIAYNFYRTNLLLQNKQLSTGKVFHPAESRLLPIIDTIYNRIKTHKRYSIYFSDAYKVNNEEITYDAYHYSYIYTHFYVNIASSSPIGYILGKQVHSLDTIETFSIKGNDKEGWSNIVCGVLRDSLFHEKLSRNHSYIRSNHVIMRPKCETNTSTDVLVCPERHYNIQGVYKLFPRLVLLLSKENIAMRQYHFFVKTAGIKTYKISLHTRGGAVIQNNPSDELQVLSLHDMQITKKMPYENGVAYHNDIWRRLTRDFEETDVYVQVPENDALQYIRLFFITLMIGWLMTSFCRNIADGIYKKTGVKLYENWK